MTSLIVALYLAAVPTVAITGKVLTPDGSGVRSGTITCRLTTPGSALDGTTLQRVASEVTTTLAATTGAVSFSLVPNDAITPTGSRYTCTYRAVVNNGRAVQWAEQWQLTSYPTSQAIGSLPVPTYPLGACMAAAPPVIQPAAGGYEEGQTLSMSVNTPGAYIYFTSDGSTPTQASTRYVEPLTLSTSGTYKALAGGPGYSLSSITDAGYFAITYRLTMPFGTEGCYPSGSVVGMKGETMVFGRANGAMYLDGTGTLQTCSTNQFRVSPDGFMVERIATQLYPTPSTPAAGTVTIASTGAHRFWVSGTGSQQLSWGTATGTGLPCTAAEGSPCSFTVSSTGTASLAAVTGSLTRAQVEAGTYPSSFIASGTRSADQSSVAFPALPSLNDWCITVRATPGSGRSWTSGNDNRPWSAGTNGTANSADLRMTSGGAMQFAVYDSSGVAKSGYYLHGLAAGSAHTFTACNSSGTLKLYEDGGLKTLTVVGAGTGLWSALPSTMYLGSSSAIGSEFSGSLAAYMVCPSSTDAICLTAGALADTRVLWLSDSIYNMDQLPAGFDDRVTTENVTSDSGTYGGNMTGGALFELADETQAYEGSVLGWQVKARGQSFSSYSGVVFEFLGNDAGLAVSAFQRAYDKVLAQAVKYFDRVISGTGVPRANVGLTGWDPTNDLAVVNGHVAVVPALAAKWGSAHVNNHQKFQDEVTAGRYTVAQIMRDVGHPTYDLGSDLIETWTASAYLQTPVLVTSAVPEVQGRVLNYIFGQATAGTWTLTGGQTSLTRPYLTPLIRVAGIADAANIASASGAKLFFPSFTCSVANCQVWVHYLVDSSSGGSAITYVDRGTGSEVASSYSTQQAGVSIYFRSILVADGLGAGSHAVELETTSASPVRVIGVTYVGAE